MLAIVVDTGDAQKRIAQYWIDVKHGADEALDDAATAAERRARARELRALVDG